MQERIRNFSIISHIDHGKSTLADRFIQLCGALAQREMASQVLDTMDLERERGITIKAQAVTLKYRADDGLDYLLNFIDTPGHVDFSYEVSRSLAACEGALLVVDASQGVEAQTVANCYTAVDEGLEVVPVLSKVDLPQAEPVLIMEQIEDVIGIEATNALLVSAKTGEGVREILEALVRHVPPPQGDPEAPLQALIVDSWFDNYLWVISLVRVVNGRLGPKQRIRVMSSGHDYEVSSVGIFSPKCLETQVLETGEVGFVVAGVKDIEGAPVGDTLTDAARPCAARLPGFRQVQPRVFAGMFPTSQDEYEAFRDALAKLRLNDASLQYEPENSAALGFGFRCGFLGMLHMEIVQARLEREYGLDLLTTAPTVVYEVLTTAGETVSVHNPSGLPSPDAVEEVREPVILASILTPQEHVGAVMQLCMEKRGVQRKMRYMGSSVAMEFELPLAEVVVDFFDRLKSVSRGFASFDYDFLRFQAADVLKLEVLVNGERVDALASIVHSQQAYEQGRRLVERLQEIVPRQMYDVALQASIGKRIVARTTVKALRKNVTSKCYGGDITRKRKLLEKQKEGKRRMKQFGRVEIPQEAFMAVLGTDKKN